MCVVTRHVLNVFIKYLDWWHLSDHILLISQSNVTTTDHVRPLVVISVLVPSHESLELKKYSFVMFVSYGNMLWMHPSSIVVSLLYFYTPAQRSCCCCRCCCCCYCCCCCCWWWWWWGGILESPSSSVCLSVCPSVCRRHGFRSVTQVCFGISIWNFICMSLVLAMSLSKWSPGGHLGFFGFRTLTSVWLWISSPNFSSILLYGNKPIDFQICHFQNGRLVAILDFLVSGLWLQFGFEFQIQTSAAHFLHVLGNRRLVILKDVQCNTCIVH